MLSENKEKEEIKISQKSFASELAYESSFQKNGGLMVELKVIKEEELREGDQCPTCHQKIEKKVARDDIQKLILAFKMSTGYEKEDKMWDRAFYRRYIPSAKRLLLFLGNWEMGVDCIQELSEKFTELNRTFTFETILTHSAQWKKDWQEKNS